ncbi:MAG: SMC family ATPase [Clostridia bacterium]|nr:SMC family ATPase [Clostridia bacterium]
MRPLQIKMAGFGSYAKETVISFEDIGSDLFLVTGDTGAGKTTIFDAISFALYGETSGSQKENDTTELCCQYADAGESYVELTFAAGSGEDRKEYTVRRTPPRWRAIKRGARKGELTRDEASVELLVPSGTAPTGKREIDQYLQDLIGLSKEQFTKIAMLAQGEFMSFLNAEPMEKRRILRKLFGTGIFGDIQSAVHEKAKQQQNASHTAWNRISSLCSQVQVPHDMENEALLCAARSAAESASPDISQAEQVLRLLGEQLEYLKAKTKAAAEQKDICTEAYDRAAAALKEDELLTGLFQDAEQAAARLAALEERSSEIAAKKVQLKNFQDAQAVLQLWTPVADGEKTLVEKKGSLQDELESLPRLQTQQLEDQKAAEAAASDAERERLSFGKKKQQVESALSILHDAAQVEAELLQLKRKRSRAETDRKKISSQAEELQKSMDTTHAELESLQDAPLELERCRQAGKLVHSAVESFNTWRKHFRNSVKAQKVYQEVAAQLAAAQAQFNAAQKAFYDSQAGILAAALEPGMPCPVCGSTAHPSPARLQAGAPSQERLEQLKQELDRITETNTESSQAAGQAVSRMQEAREQFDSVYKEVRSVGAAYAFGLPDDEQDCLQSLMNAFKELHNQLSEQVERRSELEAAQKKQRKDLPALQEKVRQAEARRQETSEKWSAGTSRLEALKKQVSYASSEQAEAELAAAEEVLRAAEQRSAKKKAAAQKSSSAVSASEARIEQLHKEIPRLEKKAAEARDRYQQELDRRSLSEEEWHRYNVPDLKQQISALDGECRSYEEDFRAARELQAHTEGKTAGRTRPDLERSRQAVETARQKRDAALDQSKEAEAAEQSAKLLTRSLEEALEAYRGPAQQAGRLDYLDKRLSGKLTGARIDLETFVLRYYLQDILAAANRRYREMTGGEYELRLLDYGKGAQGSNGGLDLTVYSRSTDATRNIDTLSGGESFMAALSLSLGMADIIEQYSAAVQLDIMFIDEGFGSLDDNARRDAVRILQGMTEGNKLVGIISHVTELKNEIDRQLIVTKNASGSHARWALS